jgi:hypothetical protein
MFSDPAGYHASIVKAGRDRIYLQMIGMKSAAVDMLYTLNVREMPPILNRHLDSRGQAKGILFEL